MSRPADHDETDFADDILPAPPGADLGEGVGPDDEEDFVAGSGAPEFLDGIDRVTVLGVFLEARYGQPRVIVAGEFGHAYAVLVGGVRSSGLVRRMRGRHHEHAIEIELFGRTAGYFEMCVMDRIESAPEDRDTHTW